MTVAERRQFYDRYIRLLRLTIDRDGNSSNYPTVNLEARACSLPIVTYNAGGSPEAAGKNACIVEVGNIEEIIACIEKY